MYFALVNKYVYTNIPYMVPLETHPSLTLYYLIVPALSPKQTLRSSCLDEQL